MIPNTVNNPRYDEVDDHPFLLLDLDGTGVAIGEEQRLLLNYGGVALLPGDEDPEHYLKYTWIRPAVPDNNLPRVELYDGFTGDPRVIRLVMNFYYDLENGLFRIGGRPSGWKN